MNIWAVLLAAGSGRRLAGHIGLAKQFLDYEGRPLFWRSALTMSRLPALRGIVFVFPPTPEDGEAARRAPRESLENGESLGLPYRLATGGERRQDSVRNALAVLPGDCEAVLIHDSARPFASAALMTRVLRALQEGAAAVIPGIEVTDTIKSVRLPDALSETPAPAAPECPESPPALLVGATYDRSTLRAVQTPQGFALAPLRAAHQRALEQGWSVTDDAALMELCSHPVLLVPGEAGNRKITNPEDLSLLDAASSGPDDAPCSGARNLFSGRAGMLPCAGLGYDVHRYGGDRPFILGGVPIACEVRVAAHSDGDTLLHALMDAMLGCIGGGDIGGLFPDSDPALENISSGILLAEVFELTRRAGLVIVNVDITVVAQVPRIAPHRQAIAANLAKMLQLPANSVNVKATTEERLGFTGEKKGIKVLAQVSALRPARF